MTHCFGAVSTSDAAQDRTCTVGAVVRSGHRTIARAVRKNWTIFFVPFRPSLTPFLGPPSPGPKLSFFLWKKNPRKRVIDEECLHQVHRRPTDLWRPCQRTTIEEYPKWTPTISWEVRSPTTVVRRRVTKKLACFVDWPTFGDLLHRCPHRVTHQGDWWRQGFCCVYGWVIVWCRNHRHQSMVCMFHTCVVHGRSSPASRSHRCASHLLIIDEIWWVMSLSPH